MRSPPLLTAALLAAGCWPTLARAHPHGWGWGADGDGNKVSQGRQVGAFTRVALRTHLDVEVTEGAAQAVEVTIDRNLQPLVETRVEGETLIIDARESVHYRGEGRVKISLAELRGLAIDGSGDVQIAGADRPRDLELSVQGSGNLRFKGTARRLEVRVEGSGDVRVQGAAERLEVRISGSGDVDARELRARSAALAISGSGDVAALLDGGPLSASIEGSGDIAWWGKSDAVSASVSGSGTIRHQ